MGGTAWYHLVFTALKIGWAVAPSFLLVGFLIQSCLSFVGIMTPKLLQMALDMLSELEKPSADSSPDRTDLIVRPPRKLCALGPVSDDRL